MNTQDFKRKLTAVFSADVAGHSRLMSENEAATVKTLETYKQVMFSLISSIGVEVNYSKDARSPFACFRRTSFYQEVVIHILRCFSMYNLHSGC